MQARLWPPEPPPPRQFYSVTHRALGAVPPFGRRRPRGGIGGDGPGRRAQRGGRDQGAPGLRGLVPLSSGHVAILGLDPVRHRTTVRTEDRAAGPQLPSLRRPERDPKHPFRRAGIGSRCRTDRAGLRPGGADRPGVAHARLQAFGRTAPAGGAGHPGGPVARPLAARRTSRRVGRGDPGHPQRTDRRSVVRGDHRDHRLPRARIPPSLAARAVTIVGGRVAAERQIGSTGSEGAPPEPEGRGTAAGDASAPAALRVAGDAARKGPVAHVA